MRELVDGRSMMARVTPVQMRVAAYESAAVLCVGLLFALTGPYGTFAQAALPERLVYWLAVILLAFAAYRPACAASERLAAHAGLPRWAGWTAAVLLTSLPLTLMVWLASYRHTPSLWPDVWDYVEFYGSVIFIGASLMIVVGLVSARVSATTFEPGPPDGSDLRASPQVQVQPTVPRLCARLPARLGQELVALEMEDHYVRVHTARGSALLLMRMRDAVAELDNVEGAQVHRSWWIARDGVRATERQGRRMQITLTNGLQVPVARERYLSSPAWLRNEVLPGH